MVFGWAVDRYSATLGILYPPFLTVTVIAGSAALEEVCALLRSILV